MKIPPGLKTKLRILIIEDSEDDTLLLIRELTRGGLDPFFARVDTLPALGSALEKSEWDIIVSDHSLPGFTSQHALEMVKQRGLDVPLIIFSGVIGEEAAVKAMKDGASDYVMKKHMGRLLPAIERELKESEGRRLRRQAERALMRSEQELNDFFEHAPVGLHWLGPQGAILRANRAELEMLGYQPAEFLGHDFSEFCADPVLADAMLQRLFEGESLKDFELRLRCKDGDILLVQLDANAFEENGMFVHSRGFIRDITARRRGEEASAYLAAIVDSSDDAIIGTNLEGIIQSWNGGAGKMYGYEASEVLGRSISILVPPYRPEETPSFAACVRQEEWIRNYESVRMRKDKTTLPVSLTFSPIKDAHGVVVGISAIERDMTGAARREAERLKLITDLTEALTNIRTLRGLLPICSSCKRIRDDEGYWEQLETFITHHTEAEFTHGICPDCLTRATEELTNVGA